MTSMRYKLGRLLQLVGLILLPVAMAGNLAPDTPVSLWRMLVLTGVGVALFMLGRLIQNTGRAG
jgi:low affinity Fe/Cu permease